MSASILGACLRHRPYPDKAAAERAKRHMSVSCRDRLAVWKCPVPGEIGPHWHVGRPARTRRRPRR
jgi:hypothetical protein